MKRPALIITKTGKLIPFPDYDAARLFAAGISDDYLVLSIAGGDWAENASEELRLTGMHLQELFFMSLFENQHSLTSEDFKIGG